jgi:hypothetical protein
MIKAKMECDENIINTSETIQELISLREGTKVLKYDIDYNNILDQLCTG